MELVFPHCNKSRKHLLRRGDSSVELTGHQLESELQEPSFHELSLMIQ